MARKNSTDYVNTNQIPNDLALERDILGSILTNPRCMQEISPILKENAFYDRFNELIYRSCRNLDAQGKNIDVFTVSEEVIKGEGKDYGHDKVMEYLIYLTSQCVSTMNTLEHALMLSSLYKRREMIRIGSDFQLMGYDKSIDVPDILQKVESDLYSISVDDNRQTVARMDNIMEEVMMRIYDASMNGGIAGIECGLRSLDELTGGWRKSHLIVIAARPAMGKTAFLLTMAKNMADNGHPVLIFSLEMSKNDLGQRLLSMSSEISIGKINGQYGEISQLDKIILQRQSDILSKDPLFIDDASDLTIYEIATKARQMKREYNIECIFIDYLQLMKGNGKFNNREQEVSSISRSLKQLAKELDVPVIALSQLNRGVEARSGDNKKPVLSDLRESGSIEQDADMVLLLHRPEYYNIEEDENGNSTRGRADVIIAKNRSGATMTLKMKFIPEFTKFKDDENAF